VNSAIASVRLDDPRDVSFALRALLGASEEGARDACAAAAARLAATPTVADVVALAFEFRARTAADELERLRASALLATYFALDPPVAPDPSA
jgi:hypothetical protein